MANAEKFQQLPSEQFARKHHRAQVVALNKHLTCDILRLTWTPRALCSNDAKQCYNRLVHSVATFALWKLGVPQAPIACMMRTLQQLTHHVCTAHGDSLLSRPSNTGEKPIHGIGQGNGAGPATWLATSAPIIEMMRSLGHGVHFESAISRSILEFIGIAFVDDKDLLTSIQAPNDTHLEVTDSAQAALNNWEADTQSTGGYLIAFRWLANGDWRYATRTELAAELSVLDHLRARHTLEQLEVSQGKRTIGAILTPNGSDVDATTFLQKKSLDWAAKISAGFLTPREAWYALTSTILQSLEFPLLALCLNEQQCKSIMAQPSRLVFRDPASVAIYTAAWYTGLPSFKGSTFKTCELPNISHTYKRSSSRPIKRT